MRPTRGRSKFSPPIGTNSISSPKRCSSSRLLTARRSRKSSSMAACSTHHRGSLRAAAKRWSRRNRLNRWWSPPTSLLRSPAPSAAPPLKPPLFPHHSAFDVGCSVFDVPLPLTLLPQFFARIARASRVLAKASRLRGLLIAAAVADRGIPASLLFLLADRSR